MPAAAAPAAEVGAAQGLLGLLRRAAEPGPGGRRCRARSGAAAQLLPLVYDEPGKLAAAKLAHENPGQTLQATALVHEAYLRLVDSEQAQHWNSRRQFYAAA